MPYDRVLKRYVPTLEEDHKDEQQEAIYRLAKITGWTGQQYPEMVSNEMFKWIHENELAVFNNVCKVFGYHVPDNDIHWPVCTVCGGCADLECCPEFQIN